MNFKKIFFIIALFFTAIVGIQNVSAASLNYDWTGYWYERYDQNGNNYSSWKLENYYVDGEVAYCIEPGIPEGTPMQQGNWSNTGLSDSLRERVSLLAYYGYTYPNHQTLKYRAAAQGMIWATILGNNTTVNFSTERYGAGTPLDISAEKNEIERLIANHYTKPSFNAQSYTLQVGQSITLTDTNNVLSNYDISVSGASYSVNGNNLTITPTTNGTITLTMTKKMPYQDNFKIFYGDGIQNMIVSGRTDPVIARIQVKSYYGSVEINKSDNETTTAQGQATLSGAVYGVYKTDGTLVTKITTNENGYARSNEVLSYGSYYLQEITASEGYYLDNTKYDFDSKGVAKVSKNVGEDVVKNYISILKQYEYVDGNTTFLNAEKNITFEIYYPNGTLYDTITTDKNGYATLNIPYGVWKFHQVNSTSGYEKIYDFFITVNYDSELEQYYNILNNALSAYLQVFKTDIETGQTIALANTTFKILNKDTNQYVSQYVGGKVYSEFKTDENGKFITYLKLSAGNYKLVEVTSPKGYLLDQDGLDFTIGDNTHYAYTTYGPFVTVNYKNTAIKGQIEVIKDGEVFTIEDGTFNYNGRTLLDGIKYNIYANEDIKSSDGNYLYYNEGDLVGTITTNAEGYAISEKLPLGKYKVVEVETQENYVLDQTEYFIELTEIDNRTAIVYSSLEMTNALKKAQVEITKTDLVNGDVIPNTILEIYTENDELIFTGKTDKDGKIIIDELTLGKYYILEKEASTGYVITDEKVYFELKENGEIVKAEMKNKPITSTVEITKIDISTSEPLPNTLIEVYNAETNELIYSGRTNEEGKIIIEELRYGKYYFIEKEAPEGYTLNSEKMYFEVLEDGEIVKCTMKDEKIVVEVPNTLNNDYLPFIMFGVTVIGLGVVAYGIKKSKKSKKK
ncbi:MAG: Cys-Gln thioester bond-forming surface protein [Bacilli bacterium]|nr:Cys-Gln thioester bond-forming surface protein [Bacilli bacterium]